MFLCFLIISCDCIYLFIHLSIICLVYESIYYIKLFCSRRFPYCIATYPASQLHLLLHIASGLFSVCSGPGSASRTGLPSCFRGWRPKRKIIPCLQSCPWAEYAEDPWHPQCPMAFLMTSIEFQDALGCFGTPDSKLWKKWLAATSSAGVCVWCMLLVSCTLCIWCLGRFWGGRRCIQRRWLRRSRDRRQHVRV